MLFRRELNPEELQHRYPSIYAESEDTSLSDKYLYIPTYKLVNGLERQGFKVVGAKQQGTRTKSREHVKHIVYMTHANQDTQLLKVNEEMPLLALTNSHNGLSSFAIDTAFFRLACSNGLLMPTSSLASARIVHKKGMETDVINAAYKVVQAFPEQIAQIEAMKNVALTQDERLLLSTASVNMAFEEEVIKVNQERNPLEKAMLRVRRSADVNPNLWNTFNVVQENIIKGGIRVIRENERGQQSIARTRAVNSIDRDTKLNKELMAIAQKMLELKTGVVA